ALRIDHPGERRTRVRLRECAEQLRTDGALPVVGHHDDIVLRALAEDEVADTARAGGIRPAVGLPIEADDLLLMGDDARLLRGLAGARHHDAVGGNLERPEGVAEALAGDIAPDDPAGR